MPKWGSSTYAIVIPLPSPDLWSVRVRYMETVTPFQPPQLIIDGSHRAVEAFVSELTRSVRQADAKIAGDKNAP